ncbi:hypothetical protein A3Q56_04490 [Intoshia linei]|uniref:Uncharacterized protein n=1 Tax=Intoshia linei TaxID=1819745 RepID=A0A177B0K1_9BILA|nr:hypothetical protein A3Q56_04490 [Intoshia linei]
MPRKCSSANCRTNYDERSEKIDSKIDRQFSSRNISIEDSNSKDELSEFQAMDTFPLNWQVFSTDLIIKYQTDYVVK